MRRSIMHHLSHILGSRRTAERRKDLMYAAKAAEIQAGFNIIHYLLMYPDVLNSGMDPLDHYLTHGRFEGRSPGRFLPDEVYDIVKSSKIVDGTFYTKKYHEIDMKGMTAVEHFVFFGYKEGFDPNYFFNTKWYLDIYPDVAKHGMNPLYHYILYGAAEGRNPSPIFDTLWYVSQNPDVRESKLNPLSHFVEYGIYEGRKPSPPSEQRKKFGTHRFALADFCNPYRHENTSRSYTEVFFSIVTPTYNTDPQWLRELHQTLCNQSYGGWEWVICDDGSSRANTIIALRGIAAEDQRVVLDLSPQSGNISYATNRAMLLAKGKYTALVDHDDLLSRDVLSNIKYHIDRSDLDPDILYTDECKLSMDGEIYDVFLKPDWSPVLLENTMYIGHLTCYRTEFIRTLGGMRSDFDGTQDYDLALRAALKAKTVVHVPCIGYLWRAIPGSTAMSLDEKGYAVARQENAILSAITQRHPAAHVRPGFSPGYWRTEYPLPTRPPLLSYVIPTAAGRRKVRGIDVDLLTHCIESLERTNFYPNVEFIIIHNGNMTADQRGFLMERKNISCIEYQSQIFNLADKINLGVENASGDYICLLNDDVEAVTEYGATSLIGFMEAHPEVGATAPFCLFEDERTQHNGVLLLEQGPSHAGIFQNRSAFGQNGFLNCRREMFAVTGAMLFVRRNLYLQLGGFDREFPLNYNDVDFCLRLRRAGYSTVVDPDIVVFHFESASKTGTFKSEKELLFYKWPNIEDEYFNKQFDQRNPYYVIPDKLITRCFNDPVTFERWLDRRIGERRASVLSHTTFSVCIPVYNQPVNFLREMLAAVDMQTWPHKEIIIVDDASSQPDTLAWFDSLAGRTDIKFCRLATNRGIVGAQRNFLDIATGDFIVPIDADDFLTVDALSVLASAVAKNPLGRIFYSDEFKSNPQSEKFSTYFKPDFDPIAISNCCFTCHVMAIQTSLLKEISAYDDVRATWCHDWDTTLRAIDKGEIPIHVPELLYAWRINPGSTASGTEGAKPDAQMSQRFVLERTLSNRNLSEILDIVPNTVGTNTGMWSLVAKRPISNVSNFFFKDVWNLETLELDLNISTLENDWVAILSSESNEQISAIITALSAPILWDETVGVVSGLLVEPHSRKILWSGGVFTRSGVFDPSAGEVTQKGGYNGRLFCQRCVDVAAPIEVMIRRDKLQAAVSWMRDNAVRTTPSNLMLVLGQQAAAEGWLIAVTPYVMFELSHNMRAVLPIDREGLFAKNPNFVHSSRWYGMHLSDTAAYQPNQAQVF